MNLTLPVLILLLLAQIKCGVMQITFNNLRNVVATYQQIFILFHNPQCSHSRKYVESFLKIDSSEKLGLVDCLREIQLCHRYNLTQFPVLAKIDNEEKPQIVDEQKFLVSHGLRDGTQDEVIVNKFVSYLEQDPSYVVIVFEDHGLPAIDSERISSDEQRIFYLQPYSKQNPSNFTKLVNSFVNNKPGCWIFAKSASNQLLKYSCDSGYDKNITQKFISLFKQKKLKKYVFSDESQLLNTNSVKQITAEEMYTILDRFQRPNSRTCQMVYVYSSKCPSCRRNDVSNVETILGLLKLRNEIGLQKYSIDQNEIPTKLLKLGLKRVPELLYLCNQKAKVFGQIFFLESIRKFIEKNHLGKEQFTQETKIIDAVDTKEQEL